MSEIWAGDWLVPYFVRRERPSGGDLGWCLHGGGGSREGKAEEGKAKWCTACMQVSTRPSDLAALTTRSPRRRILRAWRR